MHRFWESLFATNQLDFMRTNDYPSDPPPTWLCPEHKRAWLEWRDNFYRPESYVNNPFMPLSCTATHEQNREARYRLNMEQMTLVEEICTTHCQAAT